MIPNDAAAKREMLQELLMEKHRRGFPSLAQSRYFNYGAQGLVPSACLEAINAYYQKLLKDAPFTMDNTLTFIETLKQARSLLAEELNVPATSIALVESTSLGCNMALWGLDWQKGDHLLLSDSEYPGVLIAVQELARRFGVVVDTWPTGGDDETLLAALEQKLHARTRLVVLSHIPWTTGRILPLRRICALVHERQPGIRVLVDGAQSVGVLPLDLSADQVDFYAFTAHKWLCGPEGTGGFYVRPEAAADLHTTFAGPRGIDLKAEHELRFWGDSRRFEISTQPVALYAGLVETLQLHRRAGTAEERFQRLNRLAVRLHQGLRDLQAQGLGLECLQESAPDAGLVYFRVANNRRLVLTLEALNLNVRTIPSLDCVRVSIHYLTLQKEVQALLDGIKAYCQEQRT